SSRRWGESRRARRSRCTSRPGAQDSTPRASGPPWTASRSTPDPWCAWPPRASRRRWRPGGPSSATSARGGRRPDCGGPRWAAPALPVVAPPGAPGGIDVLPLDALAGRRLAFVGLSGMDAESFPRRAPPGLLADDERAAVNGVLGRPALPVWTGAADLRAPV